MELVRNHAILKKLTDENDSFVNLSLQQRVAFMWELTAELWSLKDKNCAEQRLQRNVTNLVRNKESTGQEKDKLDAKYLHQNNDA